MWPDGTEPKVSSSAVVVLFGVREQVTAFRPPWALTFIRHALAMARDATRRLIRSLPVHRNFFPTKFTFFHRI